MPDPLTTSLPDGLVETTARYLKAKRSLVAFRDIFLPSLHDVVCADFHRQWDDSLLNGSGHIAFEAFRESAKTEYAIRVNLLHALTFPSDRREYILLICSTKTIAENRLKAIEREFSDSPEMMAGVAGIPEQSGKAFEVWYGSGRKVRIETYGRGTAVRGANWAGKRPDLIICDDIQDFEDLESETQPEKDWKWFLSDVMDLGQNSRIFMIGNNLGEKCIMERVIRNKGNIDFEAFVIPIAQERFEAGQGNEYGELHAPTWPEKNDIEDIRAEREKYRAMEKLDIWYRNKMCRTVAPESQMFKRKHFRYYDPRELDASRLSIFMIVDPATSEEEVNDRTAILVVGVSSEGHWFILDVWAEREKPSVCFDRIFEMVVQWRPIVVGYEKVQYQAAIEDFLIKEMPRRNIFFNVVPLTAARRKELRIETALQPRYVHGAIWHPMQTPWVAKVESELLAFPHGEHDDVIDALAYVDQIATVPVGGSSGKTRSDLNDIDYDY